MKVRGTINLIDYIYSFMYKIWLNLQGIKVGKSVIFCLGASIQAKEKVKIGSETVIGRHVTITARNISIGKNCLFYANTIIFCNDHFKIGNRAKISRKCIFRANNIEIGDELWCNESVKIGEGGWNQPYGNLFIGNHQFIGPRSTINLSSEVILKGYGGLGVESSIYTHGAGHGQPITEGYYAEQNNVVIEKYVSVLTRSMIMPGIRIHKGVTIAANALVTHNVSENLLVGGIPAKKIKNSKVDLTEIQRNSIILNTITEGLSKQAIKINENIYNYNFNGKDIYYIYKLNKFDFNINNKIIIFFEGDFAFNCCLEQTNTTLINLKSKTIEGSTDDVSEFVRDKFRRKGIILEFNNYSPYNLNFNKFIIEHVEIP